jgi:hypothetical protein
VTKEELAAYEIKPISQIIPNWDGLPQIVRALIESAFNLEWWRGYHAPRPVTMRHVRMGQPAPEGDTHIIIGAEDYERWVKRWRTDLHDKDVALMEETRISAGLADELAFWKHQAIFYCACVGGYLSDPSLEKLQAAASGIPQQWLDEAERRLEKTRHQENSERVAHAEPGRDPGAT